VTRTAHRISAEVSLVSALPGLDVAAKEAVLQAVSRSRYPNLEAYSKAKAEVMRCRQVAAVPRFSMVDFANRLLGRAAK
jgi:hypothetical protein